MSEEIKKDSWDKFFEYWDKEADDIRKIMLSPHSCSVINLKFMSDYMDQKIFAYRGDFDLDTHTRYKLLESKLTTSLEIARTTYLDKHPLLSEKFVDAMGTALGKLSKK